jgi:subtilisin family serine protease
VRASAAFVAVSAALLLASGASASTLGAGAGGQTYTVAFASSSLPANVDKLVADAGGTIVARLPQIGGLAVVSSSPTFAAKMDALASVAAAQPSLKTSLTPIDAAGAPKVDRRGGKPSPGEDPQPEPDQLGTEQWDKMRMDVSLTGSYAVERGNHGVTVGMIDTGVDQLHPDIESNLDVADSRSFVPYEPTIQDFNGHGTWTASAVGAPINTIGISGVAPDVTLVALKTNDAAGDGLQLWIDQALVYAGDQHFDVVSSSIIFYTTQCTGGKARKQGCDDADYILAQRAVDYARDRGVTIVAALGNDNLDLSDPKKVGRLFGVEGGVVEMLGGLDGVIGVSATGYFNEKGFYSNYGVGVVDVAAPGGDPYFQPAPYFGGGRVLGAWSSTASGLPPDAIESCVGSVCALYAAIFGTSMAAPNAAGVAALVVSHYGDLSPDQVERLLEHTAAPQPCPSPRTVVYGGPFPYDQATCQGGLGYNGFVGNGIVNALAAVTSR